MNTAEIIASTISLLALLISVVTAYRTFFAKFQAGVYMLPRVALTRINKTPCIVIGCEITNSGAKSGAVDDIILISKYRQKDTKSINTFTFLPLLIRDDYSVFKTYTESDFEPFQSIVIAANSRVTRYIVFGPSNKSFSPLPGEVELHVYSRSANETEWQKASGNASFPVDDLSASVWSSSENKSIMTDTIENDDLRQKLMERLFS